MKKSNRKNLIKAFAAFALCCIGGASAILFADVAVANAETYSTDILTVDGASIRFMQEGEDATNSTAGLRFETRIETAKYDALNASEVGILLVPSTENVADANVTTDNTNVAKVVLVGTVDGEERNAAFHITEDGVEYYAYRAYLYGIDASDYYTSVQARGYYISGEDTYYTDVVTRSVGQVATYALRDTATTEDAWYSAEKYPHKVSEGIYSPYSGDQRTELQTYITEAGAPTIVKAEDYSMKCKLNEDISIPAFTATDCTGAEAETVVKVFESDGTEVEVTDGVFQINAEGKYYYEVTATDKEGRTTTETYNFYHYEWQDSLTGKSTGGTELFNVAHEEIAIDGEEKVALTLQTRENYNYPNAVFGEAIENWENKTLRFKVYNPTSNDYKIRLYATNQSAGFASANSIDSNSERIGDEWCTVVSGGTMEVTIHGLSISDTTAYPYFMIYTSAAENGGIGSEQFLAMKLYLYDFEVSDTEWWQTMTGKTANGTTVMNTENVETTIGDVAVDAVKVTTISDTSSVGNYLAATFSGSNVLLGKNTLKFKIYNPTAYEYTFRMYASTLSTATSSTGSLGTAILGGYIKIPANASTEYTVDLTELTETNCYLMFYLPKVDDANWGTNKTNYNACELYMYDFEILEWYETLVGTNSNGKALFNVETDATQIINDTQVSDVVVLKTASGHTSSMPVAVFAGSNTIDWANSTVTFKIYNPTDYDYKIRLYATSNAVAFNYGTGTVIECSMETRIQIAAKSVTEITVKVSAFTTACPYLGIYIPWDNGSSWSNGGQGSEKYLGCELYLYDFNVTKNS